MTDHLTKKQRSALMSRIRSKRTGPEMVLHGLLKGGKVSHAMWPHWLPGHPDCVIYSHTLGLPDMAVFVHGCYWHGCRWHFRLPKTNRAFWRAKIERNKKRHAESARLLKRLVFKVVVVWEHKLRDPSFDLGQALFLKKRA